VHPGFVVVGTDSHTTSHGALGAFAVEVSAAQMASVWALGGCQPSKSGNHQGRCAWEFSPPVLPKDLILYIIGQLTAHGAGTKVLEFHGKAIRLMSTSGRLTICSMAAEAGASSGIVPPDPENAALSEAHCGVEDVLPIFGPDPGAAYDRILEVDATQLGPQIACPASVDNVKPVEALLGTPIHQVVIGSCTNGRLDDIEIAARWSPAGRWRVECAMLVFPASARIYREAIGGRLSERLDGGRAWWPAPVRPCPRHSPRERWAMGRWRSPPPAAIHREPGQPRLGSLSLLPAVAAHSAIAGRNQRSPSGQADIQAVVLSLGDNVPADIHLSRLIHIYPSDPLGRGCDFAARRGPRRTQKDNRPWLNRCGCCTSCCGRLLPVERQGLSDVVAQDRHP